MADSEQEFPYGFTDKRRVQGAASSVGQTGTSNYNDVNQLRAVLATRNAGYFTPALLNTMTKNDLVYALRSIDDAAGIN